MRNTDVGYRIGSAVGCMPTARSNVGTLHLMLSVFVHIASVFVDGSKRVIHVVVVSKLFLNLGRSIERCGSVYLCRGRHDGQVYIVRVDGTVVRFIAIRWKILVVWR